MKLKTSSRYSNVTCLDEDEENTPNCWESATVSVPRQVAAEDHLGNAAQNQWQAGSPVFALCACGAQEEMSHVPKPAPCPHVPQAIPE